MSMQNAHAGTSTYFIPEWTFADRIRKARQTVDMDQKTFASSIGKTSSAVAQWEAGNSRPRDIVAVAKSIELLTRVPATWLLGFGPAGNEPPASTVKSGHFDNPIVSLAERRATKLKPVETVA